MKKIYNTIQSWIYINFFTSVFEGFLQTMNIWTFLQVYLKGFWGVFIYLEGFG